MTSTSPPPRGRQIAALGGGVIFAASLLYFGFMYARRFGVAADASASGIPAIAIDVALFSAFALHHSVLARSGIKARLAHVIPPAIERTVYVWIASLLFIVVCAAWQLVPGAVWRVAGPAGWLLHAAQIGGAVLGISAAQHVDVFDLAGVRDALRRRPRTITAPTERGPYSVVRHPLYVAFLLAVWPIPEMTATRFVFALVSTIYLLIAIPIEERDLRRTFGDAYATYATRVRYRLVPHLY